MTDSGKPNEDDFEADMGAEMISTFLVSIELDQLSRKLKKACRLQGSKVALNLKTF
jgi:hypothetical protein